MPLYEFICTSCHKKFTILCPISERDSTQVCLQCGSKSAKRLVSRFKTIRSDDQIVEGLSDPTVLSGVDENNPASLAKWAKKMAREMGENIDDEIEQMTEEELSTQSSRPNEKNAPNEL